MNQETNYELQLRRVEALLKSNTGCRPREATIDGQRIVSDGRMMVPSAAQAPGILENDENIVKLWNRYAADKMGDALTVTAHYHYRTENGRGAVAVELSNGQYINMAYLSLLDGCELRNVKRENRDPGSAYETAICGLKDGKLLGVVMPLYRATTSMGEKADPATLTESNIYGMFGCVENGFYPLTAAEKDAAIIASIEKELEDEVDYLKEKEYERDEANTEVDATESRIRTLREKLEAAKKEVAA